LLQTGLRSRRSLATLKTDKVLDDSIPSGRSGHPAYAAILVLLLGVTYGQQTAAFLALLEAERLFDFSSVED